MEDEERRIDDGEYHEVYYASADGIHESVHNLTTVFKDMERSVLCTFGGVMSLVKNLNRTLIETVPVKDESHLLDGERKGIFVTGSDDGANES